jgi:hypothetical protein
MWVPLLTTPNWDVNNLIYVGILWQRNLLYFWSYYQWH